VAVIVGIVVAKNRRSVRSYPYQPTAFWVELAGAPNGGPYRLCLGRGSLSTQFVHVPKNGGAASDGLNGPSTREVGVCRAPTNAHQNAVASTRVAQRHHLRRGRPRCSPSEVWERIALRIRNADEPGTDCCDLRMPEIQQASGGVRNGLFASTDRPNWTRCTNGFHTT